ncbi:hypothetical protein KY285_035893 [Solanum tuberosum]|nr:hypothetical protein KY285_035893 [Solanum tuberosum]
MKSTSLWDGFMRKHNKINLFNKIFLLREKTWKKWLISTRGLRCQIFKKCFVGKSYQCIQKTWLLLNTVAKKRTSRYYTEKYAEKFKLGTTIWKYAGSFLKDVNFSYLPGTISLSM